VTKMRCSQMLGVVAACLIVAGAGVRADEKPIVPLKVQIVISRYQGDKKISSLPYSLVVNANAARTSIRLGSQVPVLSVAPANKGDAPPFSGFQYKDVGTSIDCSAVTQDDGRFRLDITVSDSSVYGEDQVLPGMPKMANAPSFRSFSSTNAVILRDSQSLQYTTATDKVNGEVTKIDVTMNVLK
jgi:type II secretory pathway component HofQ